MGRRVLMAIGVDKAGNLPPLTGAASGATKVRTWAKSNGYDTILLADTSGPVTQYDVFNATKQVVESGDVDHFCIYFAGHGFLPAPDNEVWYLSGAPDNGAEAISLESSAVRARRCGIAHVTFISDTCRSLAGSITTLTAVGTPIFPNGVSGVDVEIDRVYATQPGDPALEPVFAEAQKCEGFLTTALLQAVSNPQGEGLGLDQLQPGPGFGLTIRTMKPYLRGCVNSLVSNISAALVQKTDVRVESALPKVFAVYGEPTTNLACPTDFAYMDSDLGSIELGWLVADQYLPYGVRGFGHLDSVHSLEGLVQGGEALFHEISTSVRREGLSDTIFVSTDEDFIASGEEAVVQSVNGLQRVHHVGDLGVAWFENSSLLLPLVHIDGYHGSVKVENGEVQSMWYVHRMEAEYVSDAVVRLRMMALDLAKRGSLTTAERNTDVAHMIRTEKFTDPMLGLFAAYAYLRAGNEEGVLSVARYMRRDLRKELYDMWLLRTLITGESGFDADAVIGQMPLLAAGWAFVPDNAELNRYKRALKPGLWTQFDPNRL